MPWENIIERRINFQCDDLCDISCHTPEDIHTSPDYQVLDNFWIALYDERHG